MAPKEGERKCFTFLWKLDNVSYCLEKKGEVIQSPAFVVDEIYQTKWKLGLFPRGERDGKYIGYFLYRQPDNTGQDKLKINCELAFIGDDGSILVAKDLKTQDFPKSDGTGYGSAQFVTREDVFVSRRSVFLPQDTLIARCKIWKAVGDMSEDIQCTAHTRIGVEKRFFSWNVKNFSSLEPDKKYKYEIKSTENDSPLMSIDLCLTGGVSFEEIIHFELSLQNKTIKFCTIRLFLFDVSGNKVDCNQDEFWFESLDKFKQLTFYFTKKKLLSMKSVFLPEDVLSLYFECAFSKGVVLEEAEEAHHGCTKSLNKIPNPPNLHGEAMGVNISNDNMKSLYDEQFLCDVKLQTITSTFPAHKIILSASSSVFKAMFSNNMKENDSNCVDIQDLSDDAVAGMLSYIYTARVQNLTWESASHLYVAADKYAVINLKNICSSYLKENLSSSNACEVLLLSDLHSDEDLKTAVQGYILKHDKEIINSDEWKSLMETDGKLAAETLCLRYK